MGRDCSESATLVESYHPSGSAARVRNSLQACPIVGRMKGRLLVCGALRSIALIILVV